MLTWEQLKEELLKPVTDIPNVRAVKGLLYMGLIFVGELYLHQERRLVEKPGLGKKSVGDIQAYLADKGLNPILNHSPSYNQETGAVYTKSTRRSGPRQEDLVADPVERERLIAHAKWEGFPSIAIGAPKSVHFFEGDVGKKIVLTDRFLHIRDQFFTALDQDKDILIPLALTGGFSALEASESNADIHNNYDALVDDIAKRLKITGKENGGYSPNIEAFANAVDSDPVVRKQMLIIAEQVMNGLDKRGGPQ